MVDSRTCRKIWARAQAQAAKQGAKRDLLHILRVEKRPDLTSHFPFLRLPPEIRNAIYHFHLVQAQNPTQIRRWNDGLSARAQAAIEHWEYDQCLPAPFEYPALSILAVSRQVYEETLGIFYHYNTLQLQSVSELRDFLTSIGPKRHAFVRDIMFRYHGDGAPAAFKLLGGCNNLKKLHIEVGVGTMRYGRRNHLLGAVGIGHLLKIRGLETVKVSQLGLIGERQMKGYEEAVRNALLKPKKAIKDRKRAANSQGAFKGNNVAAGKKRTVEGGKASRAKKTKLSQNGN